MLTARHGRHAFEWRSRQLTFYTSRAWVRPAPLPPAAAAAGGGGDSEWRAVPVPDDASVGHFGGQALVTLRSLNPKQRSRAR